MSVQSTETATSAPAEVKPSTEVQGDPAEAPLGEGGKKALDAERAARKAAETAASELQKQIDALNAEKMSDLEKAQKAAKDAEDAAAKATAEALRLRVAAKHGISDEDADLFLTGSDEATLLKQAARLAERTSTSPKPDLTQGGASGGTSTAALNGDPLLDDLKSKLGIS